MYPYEAMIHRYVHPYDLSPDNRFRLAAYLELKGQLGQNRNAITLEFGSLAKLSLYQRNCLLRTADNRVYHLDQRANSERSATIMNEVISAIFDRILLLANHEAEAELISFVDQALTRKNLEPFDKVYLRHILLKYGRYDRNRQEIFFHTDWLPEQQYTYRSPGDVSPVQRPSEPMQIKLTPEVLRGYYLRSGGTVYVENVNRQVEYATGEEYSYNVSAFKLFVQQLFTQTTHYVVREEKARIADLPYYQLPDFSQAAPPTQYVAVAAPSQPIAPQGRSRGAAPATTSFHGQRGDLRNLRAASSSPASQRRQKRLAAVKPLYSEYDWIPVMLGHLRARGISIGDPDIIQYFTDQPYFPELYKRLTFEEKTAVDRFLQRRPQP
ncbi:MAG: hypothetical protein AAF399_03945 [Bacteroidota bacterium]